MPRDSNKKAILCKSNGNGDRSAKRPRLSPKAIRPVNDVHRLNLHQDVPYDCRVRILAFLRPSELYGCYTLVSTQSYEDSKCPTLPQLQWGEIFCGTSLSNFLRRLSHPSVKMAFSGSRKKLTLIGSQNIERADISFEEVSTLEKNASLPYVTSLTVNVPEDSEKKVLVRDVAWSWSRMFQNLRELDVSNVHGGSLADIDLISELALFNKKTCPALEVIHWRNRIGGCRFFFGNDLESLPGLKELYVDNILADFRYDGGFGYDSYNLISNDIVADERCIFFRCNRNLQRVSLLGAKFVDMNEPAADKIGLPQAVLIKFVRKSPNLKWFKSDLSPPNIVMLQLERPEIEFLGCGSVS